MRLGSTELILILIIAIALFGTSRIAGIGKAMGNGKKYPGVQGRGERGRSCRKEGRGRQVR